MRRGFAGLPPGLFQKPHPPRVGNSSPASRRNGSPSKILVSEFQFTDAAAGNTARFYRVTSP